MKIKLKKAANKKLVYDITPIVTNITWSGSASQASRTFEFSVAYSPFDDYFEVVQIETGDIIYFYFQDKLRFLGRVQTISQSATPGEKSYKCADYIDMLLKSTVCYNFKNTTPEKITSKVLDDMGIAKGSLIKTKVKINKWIVEDESAYNVILGAYHKARGKTKKRYMPKMDGTKFCMVERGLDSGVKLKAGENITDAQVEENSESIINLVKIYSEEGKLLGTVKDKNSIKYYGTYQQTLKKEKGVNAHDEAQTMLKGIERTASVEAIGDIRCTAGKAIHVYDNNTGLWGKFWIENDSHSIQNNVHTMSLELSFVNIMEGDVAKESDKPYASGDHVCYYATGGEKYHSKRKCYNMSNPIKSRVNEAIKTGRGKCSRCWK